MQVEACAGGGLHGSSGTAAWRRRSFPAGPERARAGSESSSGERKSFSGDSGLRSGPGMAFLDREEN